MARKDVRESIQDAIDWLAFTDEVYKQQRKREDEDLAFQLAEGAWPQEVINQRGAVAAAGKMPALPGRPNLSVASIDEPIALVSAEERKANLAVKIDALSEDASDETSQILQGIYRTIERESRAQNVRSWAYQRALWAGWGVYRVSKKFDPNGGHPFDQRLVLERIVYQGNVFLDPFARQPDWSDMKRAMVIDDMPWVDYKRKYPKSKITRGGVDGLGSLAGEYPEWVKFGEGDDDTCSVRIAEDWRVEITETRYVLLDDGSVAPEDDIPDGREAVTGDAARDAVQETRTVYHRVINCQEELEAEQEWDGQYIPLIPTIGREMQPVKGKRLWLGMVTNAKDAIRLTNYSASGAIEMAALEPRAPFEVDPLQIEGFEDFWNSLNVRNWPYLPHHSIVRGQLMPPPQRVQADVGRMGPSMQLLSMGRQFVQAATAIYPPALGENTPAHRSGRAITALQDQSLQANTPYLDNLANVSMQYEAIVVLDLIPHVYDRPGRIARIQDAQGRSRSVVLNAPFIPHPVTGKPVMLPNDSPQDQQTTRSFVDDPNHPAKNYDLSKGRYGVSVTVGKSEPSRNAEGSDSLSALMQAEPTLVPLLGPEWAKFQDFPGSDVVADLLTKYRDHMMPWLAPPPAGPPPPDPQMLQQQIQQLQGQLQAATQALQTKQVEQQGKLQITQVQEQAETQRAREANETKMAVAAISAKVEQLTTMLSLFFEERSRLGAQTHDAVKAGLQRAHEALMGSAEHQAALAQTQAQAIAQPIEPAPVSPEGNGTAGTGLPDTGSNGGGD